VTSAQFGLLLLAAKIVMSAGIVIGVAAAAERLGPRLGGLIIATPQLAVLALIFFTLEQGPAFAANSAFWNIPGVCTTVPVYLAYLGATLLVPVPRLASVAAGVASGIVAFVAAAMLLAAVPLDRVTVVPFAAAVCGLTAWLMRGLPDTATLTRVRTSPALLATRAATSVVTVLAVTSAAHIIGPKWAGLVTGFPVNSLPVMAILHVHYGVGVVKPFIKIFPAAAFGICLFNLVAWLALERLGLVTTIALGYAVDIAYLTALHALRPTRQSRPARSGRAPSGRHST
jgi:hypothetical protein